ncbi:hypothetical protein [Paenibacillus thermotolerans]|uniref:glycoside hydrolase family 38 N-terminal domain-containing protein n=1 Tax=Paenibacillus thermotolerans TaxID=3027807 RepID=UPI002368C0B4|nr:MULTISPECIES: hypothetical protein [unclassified Paenibacillus]
MSKEPSFYYFMCNHWTQGGIGFAFPSGWYNDNYYRRTFSSVYTIEKMLDAADQYPGMKVSMELDAYAYEEVEKEAPECIARLKEYIKQGKAGIDGGTYGQPFGQDYGWEPNIRQLTYGRKTIRQVLDVDVRTFLVEEQWFHPQLPQLLKKSGFLNASLQNQNSGQVKPMNTAMIRWKGIDGTAVPAIPANDLMVSCVRQYTSYDEYKERLELYERPLLFQWVEIWPPGMDWGASVTPFEKAIRQVELWGGQVVRSLDEYFERESAGRTLEEVYISLDESNYANNWYQGGGWGYDGDKVIVWDVKAEQALLAYEALAARQTFFKQESAYPEAVLDRLWRKLLVLQNHDFSVARSYRAVTEDGLVTDAGSLGVAEYQKIVAETERSAKQIIAESDRAADGNGEFVTFANLTGIEHRHTAAFKLLRNKPVAFVQNGKPVPFDITASGNGTCEGYVTVDLPAFGLASVQVLVPKENSAVPAATKVRTGQDWIEDDRIRIEWVPGSWAVRIRRKLTGESVDFIGFTGPIGKMNEHGGPFPALSPAHEIFTFAFDGTTHSPDQLSVSRVQAAVVRHGSVKSTLALTCKLLTLHTTDTPVAFAEAKVTIDHATGAVECVSHLYTGVHLSVQSHAVFRHNLPGARYFRDFPFGEEEAFVEHIYPNSYTRVTGDEQGFTLVHRGTQRVKLVKAESGGEIRHLLARDRVHGDYEWKFYLRFGRHQPWESARYAKTDRASTPMLGTKANLSERLLDISDARIILSAFYQAEGKTYVRLVNYSAETVDAGIAILSEAGALQTVNFMNEPIPGNFTWKAVDGETRITAAFAPWEIVTLQVTV